jgi:hypothetical protein
MMFFCMFLFNREYVYFVRIKSIHYFIVIFVYYFKRSLFINLTVKVAILYSSLQITRLSNFLYQEQYKLKLKTACSV